MVGETNDGDLNDIRGLHVTRDARRSRRSPAPPRAPVEEGAVGAGTGTIAFGWKGGIGTASRASPSSDETWTVGVLVQIQLRRHARRSTACRSGANCSPRAGGRGAPAGAADGSCMIVVATDAPLDARDLERLAARAVYAMARTGSTYSNGSGDFAIAFSTHPSLRVTARTGRSRGRSCRPTACRASSKQCSTRPKKRSTTRCCRRPTTTGNGRTVRAIPIEPLKALLAKHGR